MDRRPAEGSEAVGAGGYSVETTWLRDASVARVGRFGVEPWPNYRKKVLLSLGLMFSYARGSGCLSGVLSHTESWFKQRDQ
jgi:hypothetical protein